MKQSIISKFKRAAMYLLGFSATPMLTACYGMPYYEEEVNPTPFDDICGTVYDDGKPIPGIKITSTTYDVSTITDSEGKYHLDQFFDSSVRIVAEDIDGKENGEYFSSAKLVTADDHLNANFTLEKR